MGLLNLFKSSYRSYDKITGTVPDETKKDVDEALAETKKKNYLAAINIYRRILTDYPDSGVLRNNLGCCLADLERFDEAEIEFFEAIRIIKFNRDKGIFVPRSYPKEPQRNLIKLYKSACAKKYILLARRPPQNQIACQHGPKRNIVQKFLRNIKREGIIAACKKIPSFLYSKLNPATRWQEKVLALRAEEFDRKNNSNTAGIISQDELEMNNKNQSHAVYYRGSDSLFFNNALSSLKINFNEYAFIDFGSGKGKALLLASAFPFKKIIGIEFSEDLNAIARENIRQLKKDNIEAYCMDAVDYKIPEDPLVCYFYDPFDDYIMAKVIGNMRQSYNACKRNIVIVYNNCRFYNLFDAEEWLERLNHIGPVMIWSSK